MEKESRFYETFSDDAVRCTICPRKCVVQAGKLGFCNVKENRDGRLVSLTYGQLSAIAVDQQRGLQLHLPLVPELASISIEAQGDHNALCLATRGGRDGPEAGVR